MKCKFCNEELQEGYKFCTNCGMPIAEEENDRDIPEYFEVVEDQKEKSKYDFSEFLGDYKREEEKQREESKSKRPVFEKDFTDSLNAKDINRESENFNDLEDTKKRRLFERTEYNLFEDINKNKSANSYDDNESSGFFTQYKKPKKKREKTTKKINREENSEVNRNFYVEEEYVPEGYISKEELKRVRKKDRNRSIFHIVFNIFIVVIAGVISYFAGPSIQRFLGETMGIFLHIPEKFFLLMLYLAILFLLIPFFKCKGKAKVILLILSILISWTLIGWIVLMIVASLSNRKWDKKVKNIAI